MKKKPCTFWKNESSGTERTRYNTLKKRNIVPTDFDQYNWTTQDGIGGRSQMNDQLVKGIERVLADCTGVNLFFVMRDDHSIKRLTIKCQEEIKNILIKMQKCIFIDLIFENCMANRASDKVLSEKV